MSRVTIPCALSRSSVLFGSKPSIIEYASYRFLISWISRLHPGTTPLSSMSLLTCGSERLLFSIAAVACTAASLLAWRTSGDDSASASLGSSNLLSMSDTSSMLCSLTVYDGFSLIIHFNVFKLFKAMHCHRTIIWVACLESFVQQSASIV